MGLTRVICLNASIVLNVSPLCVDIFEVKPAIVLAFRETGDFDILLSVFDLEEVLTNNFIHLVHYVLLQVIMTGERRIVFLYHLYV